MTQDDIIRFAIQCRLVTTGNRDGLYMDALTEFAKLVAAKATAKEREAVEKALAQEPVAWRTPKLSNLHGKYDYRDFNDPVIDISTGKPSLHNEPLYLTPPQPEQEPVAYLVLFEGAGKLLEFKKVNYIHGAKVEHIPLYTTPPQRRWVGLEGEEIRSLWEEAIKPNRSTMTMVTSFARAIESKMKELNT